MTDSTPNRSNCRAAVKPSSGVRMAMLGRFGRFGPVRRNAGATGVPAIVGAADRIGEHRHAGRTSQRHHLRNHIALADALVVIAHQQEIHAVDPRGDRGQQRRGAIRATGRSVSRSTRIIWCG